MSVLTRNNVQVRGVGDRSMMFAHGFGCDQNMWRYVAPSFEDEFRTVLFDHVGAGGSDLSAYDRDKYATLDGYADDVVEIARELGLRDITFVGHSVSAMIGVLASLQAPDLFENLVMVGPLAALYRRCAIMSEGSARIKLRNCWNFLITITWDGQPPWRQRSWAILHVRN